MFFRCTVLWRIQFSNFTVSNIRFHTTTINHVNRWVVHIDTISKSGIIIFSSERHMRRLANNFTRSRFDSRTYRIPLFIDIDPSNAFCMISSIKQPNGAICNFPLKYIYIYMKMYSYSKFTADVKNLLCNYLVLHEINVHINQKYI